MSDASRPGEFDLIARYFAPIAGPGGLGLVDDAALLAPPAGCDLVLTKDLLVAGVHFFPDDPPEAIARKALRVNLSDLAAKGAEPLGFLLGLGLPQGWREGWLAAFARGLGADAAAYACPLLGGDTVSSPERLVLSITALGTVPKGAMVRRTTGRPGDVLHVTGTIGAAAMGLVLRLPHPPEWAAALPAATLAAARAAYLLPDPAMPLAQALRDHARAAMDISDGLIGDAMKLAGASGTGLEIDARLVPMLPGVADAARPCPALLACCLTGGDDYQVLAAIPPDGCGAFEETARKAGRPVTRIGTLTVRGTRILGLDGETLTLDRASYGHF